VSHFIFVLWPVSDCDSADDSCRESNQSNNINNLNNNNDQDNSKGPRRLIAAAPINASSSSSGNRCLSPSGTLSLKFSESSIRARRHHIRQRNAWSNEEVSSGEGCGGRYTYHSLA